MELAALLFLLEHRRWEKVCLRANIATPEQIEVVKKTKRAHLDSNILRRDGVDTLIRKTLKEIAPEWSDDTQIILNRNVTCRKHRDGNDGHSWILWLGDFDGGALVFETGERIAEKHKWHKIDGQVPHWNEPHTGNKYSVILYQKTKRTDNARSGTCGKSRRSTKREMIADRSRGLTDPRH